MESVRLFSLSRYTKSETEEDGIEAMQTQHGLIQH